MKKEINSVRENETNKDLYITQEKIMQTKEDIVSFFNLFICVAGTLSCLHLFLLIEK